MAMTVNQLTLFTFHVRYHSVIPTIVIHYEALNHHNPYNALGHRRHGHS